LAGVLSNSTFTAELWQYKPLLGNLGTGYSHLEAMHRLLFLGLVLLHSIFLGSSLKIASALNTIEYTPELIASKQFYTGTPSFVNGGVANIVSDTSIDLAANAETQALREYAVSTRPHRPHTFLPIRNPSSGLLAQTHKNLRIIYTVVEVAYRLVANKKGITTLADLKGKKIGTFPSTSAAYFVEKLLASAGLKTSDYTVVSGNVCSAVPCGAGSLPYMLQYGSIDAIGMWEPTVQLAIDAIGESNLAIFQNKTIYREIFNLHILLQSSRILRQERILLLFSRP
jgi:hypothetical protein